MQRFHSSSISPGDIPTLAQLGFSDTALRRAKSDAAAAGGRLRGGERRALEGMQVGAWCCACMCTRRLFLMHRSWRLAFELFRRRPARNSEHPSTDKTAGIPQRAAAGRAEACTRRCGARVCISGLSLARHRVPLAAHAVPLSAPAAGRWRRRPRGGGTSARRCARRPGRRYGRRAGTCMWQRLASIGRPQRVLATRCSFMPTCPLVVAGGLSWLLFELMWRDFFKMVNLRLANESTAQQTAPAASNTAPSIFAMA